MSDFTDSFDSQEKKDFNSWRKSNKKFSSSFFNIDRDSGYFDGIKGSKNLNSSTLSLHIAAYENTVEADSDDSNADGKKGLKEKCETWQSAKNFVQQFLTLQILK
uniref:Uncharacterized protein n=1 Tax=Panagrolaimus sp. ES5 TaxID=591445 RepID=A0AC34G2K5_9BILA